MNKENILKKSLEVYCLQAQFDQFHEEVGELMTALNHYKRNRCSLEEVIVELVDVRQTLDGLQMALGISEEDYLKIEKKQWEKFNKQMEM
jgi:predicted CopG family antitoxin